ncbi:hypothetical protein V1504DRAFT_478645 [Lipomyces starkeyi]
MIETVEESESWATQPVVHQWASQMQDDVHRMEFMKLAVMVVGLCVPLNPTEKYWVLQRRLLPHADICSHWILKELESFYRRERQIHEEGTDEVTNMAVTLDATHRISILYANQAGKLEEAEKMYQRALKGKEEALEDVPACTKRIREGTGTGSHIDSQYSHQLG